MILDGYYSTKQIADMVLAKMYMNVFNLNTFNKYDINTLIMKLIEDNRVLDIVEYNETIDIINKIYNNDSKEISIEFDEYGKFTIDIKYAEDSSILNYKVSGKFKEYTINLFRYCILKPIGNSGYYKLKGFIKDIDIPIQGECTFTTEPKHYLNLK